MRDRSVHSMLMKLRGCVAQFQIELGRWCGVNYSDRRCWECDADGIEDSAWSLAVVLLCVVYSTQTTD